jgi:hypothetical protein
MGERESKGRFERSVEDVAALGDFLETKASQKLIGRPKVAPELEGAVRASLSGGVGVCRTARTLGCGVGTVQRIKAGMVAGATGYSGADINPLPGTLVIE